MLADAKEGPEGPEVRSSAQSLVDAASEKCLVTGTLENVEVAVASFL